jgi:DNA-directed RNA polymerase specialized sigma24 family protein
VIGSEPDPAFAALLAEECQRLLERLDSDELREMALLKLEGYTAEEIAERLDCSLRTVHRRLALIRRTWEELSGGSSE